MESWRIGKPADAANTYAIPKLMEATTMRWAYLILSITLLLGSLATASHATTIPVTLVFADPNWTGSASYDDTTGQPWTIDAGFTAYEIVAMNISCSVCGPATWTEADLEAGLSDPPTYGLIVDSEGRVLLFASAFDTGSSQALDANTSFDGTTNRFTLTEVYLGDDEEDNHPYTARVPGAAVPEPATLLLLASGVAGLSGAAWRRNRKK